MSSIQLDKCEQVHQLRYRTTYELLNSMLHSTVLDLGGATPFTEALQKAWPGSQVHSTGLQELRGPFTSPLGSYDLVLCLEVIEHLHDLPTSNMHDRAQWIYSGMRAMLNAVREHVGGQLVITTPNSAGLKALWNVIHDLPPQTYLPHVRELTMHELVSLVEEAGYRIETKGQWIVWQHHGLSQADALRMHSMLSVPERFVGDDLYLVARRA